MMEEKIYAKCEENEKRNVQGAEEKEGGDLNARRLCLPNRLVNEYQVTPSPIHCHFLLQWLNTVHTDRLFILAISHKAN